MPGARRAARVLLALAAATILAAPAVADHVYSHQYRVFGRVIDTEGNPLQGAIVFIEFLKTQQPGRLSFETNCTGDYGFARNEHFHMHGLSTVAQLQVTVFDPSNPEPRGETTLPADRNLRKVHLDWKLDDPGNLTRCPGAREEVARKAFVFGRLWNSTDEKSLEGITVWGDVPGVCRRTGDGTYVCQEVALTVRTSDGREQSTVATVNNYGDYFAWFDFGTPFDTATVTAKWLDHTKTAQIAAPIHTAELDFIQGEPVEHRPAPAAGLLAALAAAALVVGLRRRA